MRVVADLDLSLLEIVLQRFDASFVTVCVCLSVHVKREFSLDSVQSCKKHLYCIYKLSRGKSQKV